MKKNLYILFFGLFAAVSASQASVILMDYDDGIADGGHDVAVRDGAFEITTARTNNAVFSEIPNWTDLLNSGLNTTQVNSASGVGRERNRVITSGRNVDQSLGYMIAFGDQFQASTFETANRTGVGTWEDAVFGATGLADAGEIDKTLMLRFETNGSVASNEFSSFDNISLEAIPEPAVITFIGLFGGSLLWLKRRLR